MGDVRSALFLEACLRGINLAPFLADPELDVNAADADGDTGLLCFLHWVEYNWMINNIHHLSQFPELILPLLRAGVDPRIENRQGMNGVDRLRSFWQRLRAITGPFQIPREDDILISGGGGASKKVVISVRYQGVQEKFVYDER